MGGEPIDFLKKNIANSVLKPFKMLKLAQC
jgi:hypothetical protein